MFSNITNTNLSTIANWAQPASQQIYQQIGQNPLALKVTLAATALAALGYILSSTMGDSDLKTIRKIAREIHFLKPTIGDGNAYFYAASSGTYINELSTKKGTLSMMAAGLRAHINGNKYGEDPADILRLGQDLLKKRSGQCDHMAAAVVAKIVEHIRRGGRWNSPVELVGNGSHAYVLLRRQGKLEDPKTWGPQTICVDTWLSVLGVHPDYKDQLTTGDYGVLSVPKDVVMNANVFFPHLLKITHSFSVDELHRLAKS